MKMTMYQTLIAATAASIVVLNPAHGAETTDEPWTVVGSHLMDVAVLKDGQEVFKLDNHFSYLGQWRSGGYLPWDGILPKVEDGMRVYENDNVRFYQNWYDHGNKPLPGALDLRQEVAQTGPQTFVIRYIMTPELDMTPGRPDNRVTRSLAVGSKLLPSPFFRGGSAVYRTADGKTELRSLPPAQGGFLDAEAVTLKTDQGATVELAFDPPLYIHTDNGELRLFSGRGELLEGGRTYTQTITLTLPGQACFEPAGRMVDTSDWFVWDVDEANDLERPSALSASDWQDKPAGRYGRIKMQGDEFVYEKTGEPVKLWGVNPLKADGTVDKKYLADSAAMMEKMGMNLARFHAFAKPHREKMWAHMLKILDPEDGLKFHEGHLDLLDYGFARMKEHGIYSFFSYIYGWYPTPADKERLINWEEAQTLLNHPGGSFYHKHALMPDVQELMIQAHVNLLNHINPYTGLRYADDPALAALELQNEENIFLQMRNHDQHLDQAPTYKKRFYRRFADWLKKRYDGRDALAEAWGDQLTAEENLQDANISPFPGWYEGAPTKRVADQMLFLFHVQDDFYKRWEQAVRDAGYEGELIGSCWQAADWVGHLYNVLSDREIGMIDRHNYNTIDLQQPGVGLMSAGLQSVLDRPFSFSEWAGGGGLGKGLDVSQIAVYGMGLQGWDASMQFAWNEPGFLDSRSRGSNNNCNDFTKLSQYPALSRMVRRGDVEEGDVIANRRISLPALKETGDVGVTEVFSLLGAANNKSFNGAVPSVALAAGRVVLEFVDGPVEQPVIDESEPYVNTKKKEVRSETGQLRWDYSDDGYYTVDTPGTKALIGHAPGRRIELDGVALTTENPFVCLYVSAVDPEETIADARSVLITAVARGVDKDWVFDAFADQPMKTAAWDKPKGPVLVEPVRATIELDRRNVRRVVALDHGGHLPEDAMEIPWKKTKDGARFTLDGAKSKTVYYLVEF